MIKSKKQSLIVIGVFTLVLMLVTTTYAFFNYTRTGTANVIKTGRISFSTNQTDTINLTNVFPIDKTTIGTDTTNTDEVVISITGDTTYTEGLEYLVTAVDVNNTIGSGNNQKSVPISISVSASNLGEEDEEYFDNRDDANNHLYRVLAGDVIENNGRIAVGYIKSGATGVNGTLTIKAYLDKDKIAISDTYDGTENDNMGTTTEWVDNRTVLTTAEWNALQTDGVSFKIKVEANEGIWVEEIRTVNVMNTFPTVITNEKTNIKEVYFNKMGATRMQNAYDAATIKADLTYNNEGKVLAWLEENPDDNTKYNLIIASDGDTYLTTGNGLFESWSGMNSIEFDNINTSRVTSMNAMFFKCQNLSSIDLSNFNTSNVTSMSNILYGSNNLISVNMNGLGSDSLTNINYMFSECGSIESISMREFNFGTASMASLFSNLTNLESIDLIDADTSDVTNMGGLFNNCSSLVDIDISYLDTTNVTNMGSMFANCSNLETLNISNLGGNNLSSIGGIFHSCTALREIYMSNFDFGTINRLNDIFTQVNVETLTKIDLSNSNTSSLISLAWAFDGLTALTDLDLSNINTSNVTTLQATFRNCSSLTNLDLSSFDTSLVTTLPNIFQGDTNLLTIYVSNSWIISSSSFSHNMFGGCTSLVGGNGTIYDSSKTDGAMAIIDGTNNQEGYLTDIADKPTS